MIYAVAGMAMTLMSTGCEGEKDLVIIEGNLPIKSSTLYMVGDATPTGWNIDSPTPMTPGEEDPLIFSWEGTLNTGELKLCLIPGSWDNSFIRPLENGTEIGQEPIVNATFQMHPGDPDEKWRVTTAGTYRLEFNLREWTMSTSFLGGLPEPEIEPIEAEKLYIVGNATPAGWNIDAPTELVKTADYTFVYEGQLIAGELKACATTGNWDVDYVRPASDGVTIGKTGVAESGFVYTASPDNKWVVTDPGIYRLEFNLREWTIKAEYKGEITVSKDPIETETLFMIGDATPGGWSMDDASEYTRKDGSRYIFVWEGELVEGDFKVCTERDGTFSCPFIRPLSNGCEVSKAGVASPDFVYTTNPDDKWHVTEAGRYRITFDLENYSIAVESI